MVATEHTIETPIYKGAMARAVNATTGKEIWTISDYTGEFTAMSYAMADGYNTWLNGLDNQIYVVGRGPSASTITAPSEQRERRTSCLEAPVTDISSGTTGTTIKADFPQGVASIIRSKHG